MVILLYDGSFDGLLTAFFEVFEYRYAAVQIIKNDDYFHEDIFAEKHEVITDPQKADRVSARVRQHLGKSGFSQFLKVHLSEKKGREIMLLTALGKMLQHPGENILQDYADADIMEISKITKSVSREVHRMHAFVRFEKMKDDLFFAKIEPDFDVLPLLVSHFKKRYSDQKWLIYDLKRQYGLLYDLADVHFFSPDLPTVDMRQSEGFMHEEEAKYQKLWQRYFFKTNIVERKNEKLHRHSLPKRYWKYLTEKF